jgi:tetratricopeptide (TPR) repeat protein
MVGKFLSFALCTATILLHAADNNAKWLRVRSGNFEVLTTANEKRARETLVEFERVLSFFEQSLQRPIKPDVPLRIILFRNEKEFGAYRTSESAAAYYQPGPDADYIVMHNAGDARIAIHEFVHLLVKHSYKTHLPIWLNEGIAELYSTMQAIGNKVQIGGLIPGHIILFRSEKPIPLPMLLDVDRGSKYYNRKQHAGMFYAESWALTHMLQLSPAYRQGFGKFFELMDRGSSSSQALEAAYGKPIARIEEDLEAYLRGDSFFGVNFDAKLRTKLDSGEVSSESPQQSDVDTALAALLAATGRRPEALALLGEASTKDPQNPAVAIAKGYLEWRDGHYNEARAEFRRAFELGSQNKRVLLDLARMSAGSDPDTATAALMRLSKLESPSLEVKLLHAELLLRKNMFGAAHGALSDIGKVSPEEAYRLLRARARIYDGLNMPAEAMTAATDAQKYAKSESEKEYSKRFVDYLESRKKRAENAAASAALAEQARLAENTSTGAGSSKLSFSDEEGDSPGKPELRRRYTDEQGRQVREYAAVERSPHGVKLQEVKGVFVALQCSGGSANVMLRTPDGKTAAYQIREPNNLVAKNRGQGMEMELNCGPQTPKPVSVWFESESLTPGQTGIAGILWQIHFE